MLCDKCGKNEANIHISRIVNGAKVEHNLCGECAGILAGMFGIFPIGGLFGDMREMSLIGIVGSMNSQSQPKTPMDERDFEAMGLLTPGKSESAQEVESETVEELNVLLKRAVDTENYEEAARLRDKIYTLDKKTQDE